MLYYDKIDVSEGIAVTNQAHQLKTSASRGRPMKIP